MRASVAALLACVWTMPAGAQTASPAQSTSQPAPPIPAWDMDAALDPDAPMADLPGIEVPWPDLSAPVEPPPPLELPDMVAEVEPVVLPPGIDPGGVPEALASFETAEEEAETLASADEPEGDAAEIVVTDPDRERDYRVVVRGVDDIADSEFNTRFAEMSELEQRDGDDANVAQLSLRADADEALLTTLLRNKGYYDALVTSDIVPSTDGADLIARLDAEPGPIYRYSAIDLPGLDAATGDVPLLRDAFEVTVGDPVNADILVTEQSDLRTAMRENGYAFGDVGEELVTIDHDVRGGTLNQPVTPGGKFRFGRIVPRGNDLFGARHLGRIARFDPGDLYQLSKQVDLRNAIIATGLVSTATVEPVVSAADPGVVDVVVDVTAAPPRTIAGELGYGTGEGFRAEASWTHRNLFRPEGAFTVRGIAGTREQLAATTLRFNNFRGRDRILTLQALASNLDRDAFDAVTATVSASYEQKTTLLFQRPWTWSAGLEIVATSEQPKAARIARREFYIAALPLSGGYDGSDDLLNPTRGFRLFARVSPEYSWVGQGFSYVRTQLDGSAYLPVGERVVIAGRARLGTIAGAGRANIAPSRLFYAGGGGSVRGFSFQGVGPRDPANIPLGGKSLTEVALEARIRFGNFGVVPFIDAGHVGTGTVPRFSDLSVGAGIGGRYYSSFGPIRVDVATPLTRRPGDPRVTVYVSLGQAF